MDRRPGSSRVICSTRQPGIGQSLFMLRSMGSDASPFKHQPRPAQSTQTAGEPHQGGRPRGDDAAGPHQPGVPRVYRPLEPRDRSTVTVAGTRLASAVSTRVRRSAACPSVIGSTGVTMACTPSSALTVPQLAFLMTIGVALPNLVEA